MQHEDRAFLAHNPGNTHPLAFLVAVAVYYYMLGKVLIEVEMAHSKVRGSFRILKRTP